VDQSMSPRCEGELRLPLEIVVGAQHHEGADVATTVVSAASHDWFGC
jgi:hypothetical protein